MAQVKLTIIFPSDPFGRKVGGAETYINEFIKFSPEDFDIEFIGVTANEKERPVKKWSTCRLDKREFKFYPLFFVNNENDKKLIPLSLRFTIYLALSGISLKGRVIFFNRIEPAIIFRRDIVPKMAMIHTDIKTQMQKAKGEVLWSKFPFFYFIFERLVFQIFNRVYVVSNSTLEFYRLRYDGQKEKFSFLPAWADSKLFYPVDEPKQLLKNRLASLYDGLPADKKWVLFVGRLQEVKAPFRLIESFCDYSRRNNNVFLIIIGEGNLKQATELHAKRLNVEDKVLFLKEMPPITLVNFYRAAELLLLTSNYEGMPKCVLEALACGVPVVSTDVGEVGLVVKNGFSGERVSDFSAQAISLAMGRVLEDALTYSMGNCVEAVSIYKPQRILISLFEDLRNMYSMAYGKIKILGVSYKNLTFSDAISDAISFIGHGQKANLFFLNLDCLHKAQQDEEYKNILNDADIVLGDGIGIRLVTRILGGRMLDNCNGSDFSPALIGEAARRGYSVFFLGGMEGVAAKAAETLKKSNPDIEIAGALSGYFNDDQKVIDIINASGANILFVGMGVPLQEKWIARNRKILDPELCLGVGALFDYLSGRILRAPKIIQRMRMEWLWRLLMEPKRLWKRYIIDDMVFFGLILKQRIFKKRGID